MSDHAGDAQALEARGLLAEAARAFAQAWDFDRAIELALRSSAPHEAYTHALLSLEPHRIEETITRLEALPEACAKAASHASLRGRSRDLGRLLRAAGDSAGASEAFERAGELSLAAHTALAANDAVRAGRLFERRLAEVPEDGDAALGLGRILLAFGRHEAALRVLQRARALPGSRDAAGPELLRVFVALGFTDSANELLDELRTSDPSLPTDPRQAAQSFGTPRGEGGPELVSGRYAIERLLGAGGSGRVFAAKDTLTGRDVAIKVLHTGRGMQGRDALTRFAREAQVALGIAHPNVVDVYEYVADGPYVVMERMSGTLEDRLVPGQAWAPSVTVHVARSIVRALEVVHRRGVVHRDLKPANVFIGAAGEIKVGDFGVAHLVDAKATQTGAMLGSLATMAPEQITGSAAPSPGTDFYALGVIVFRLLTGELPFPGPDFLAQHRSEPIPSVCAKAPWLPVSFEPVLTTLLAKDPEARPKAAIEVLGLLEPLELVVADAAFERRAHVPAANPRASTIPPAAQRFVPRATTKLAGRDVEVLFDTQLEREVVAIPVSPESRPVALRMAKVVVPSLAAVLGVRGDDEVLVEWPAGTRGGDLPLELRWLDSLAATLDALEAAGCAHGAIGPDSLVFGDAQVFLVPRFDPEARIEDDRRALARLFGMRG